MEPNSRSGDRRHSDENLAVVRGAVLQREVYRSSSKDRCESGFQGFYKMGEPEKAGIAVKREEVSRADEQLMAGRKDGQGRRKRARELGEITNKAIEERGSSYLNLTLLIQDILGQVSSRG
ncbi:hypothetical protein SLE2022_101120 [Rubroshorea leprosula]